MAYQAPHGIRIAKRIKEVYKGCRMNSTKGHAYCFTVLQFFHPANRTSRKNRI